MIQFARTVSIIALRLRSAVWTSRPDCPRQAPKRERSRHLRARLPIAKHCNRVSLGVLVYERRAALAEPDPVTDRPRASAHFGQSWQFGVLAP